MGGGVRPSWSKANLKKKKKNFPMIKYLTSMTSTTWWSVQQSKSCLKLENDDQGGPQMSENGEKIKALNFSTPK